MQSCISESLTGNISQSVTGKTFQQESFLLENFFIPFIISQFELQSEIRVTPRQETLVQLLVQ